MKTSKSVGGVVHTLEALEGRLLRAIDAAFYNALPESNPAQYNGDAMSVPASSFANVTPPPAPVTTILNSGPVSNRVDIVLVGDGYTSADLPLYRSQAASAINSFFSAAPFNMYKSFFNVHRVDVTSAQSGVDGDPTQGVLKSTALDMSFWTSGIERLLGVNTSKASSYAANAPGVDQILALGNSTKYGGAGYTSANVGTFSGGNASSLEVALHEFGHSFADLADEYTYGGPTTWTGGEPSAANVSIYTASQQTAQQKKWYRWLDKPEVDTFEGANYSSFGIYRPTANSKMRELYQPWGSVNTEAIIIAAYKTVKPIDSATAGGTYPSSKTFTVDPVDPVGNPLKVEWLIDGTVIPGATGLNYSPAGLGLTGNHTLRVRVTDTTALVRDPVARSTYLTQTKDWTVTFPAVAPSASISGTVFNDTNANAIRETSEPPLANWRVFLDADNDGVFDTTEKSVLTTSTGSYTFSNLTAGTYRVYEVPQTGYRRTTPATAGYLLTLTNGLKATNRNFGNTQKVLISGTVFNDSNANQIRDRTESTAANWRVFLDTDNDGVFDTTERSVLTTSTGTFAFDNIAAGTYYLRIVKQKNVTLTTPTAGGYKLVLAAGTVATGRVFGVKPI